MMTEFSELLKKPITTLEEGKAWIEELYKQERLFHFEDSPEEIGNTVEGKWVRTFTDEECVVLRGQVDRLYTLNWGEYDCPIGYALHVLDEQ